MRYYRDITQVINDVEDGFPVQTLMYRGIPLWPIIRLQLASIMFWEKGDPPDSSRRYSLLRSIPSFTARVFHDVADYMAELMLRGKLGGTSEVLFLTAGFEYVHFSGTFYNKFLDPVKELLDRRGVSHADVELGFAGKDYTPKHFPTIDLRSPVRLLSRMASIGAPRFSGGEKSVLAEFSKQCANNHKLSIDVRDIMLSAVRISSFSRMFGEILSTLHPKVCMFVCYYQDTTMALAHACRKLGIRTVEIQHSVINKYDWNWCNWNAISNKGYSTMPDIFWSWGATYSAMLDCWQRHPGTNLTPHVGGNLWIGKWRKSAAMAIPETTSQLRATGRTILYTIPFGDVKLLSEWFPPEFEEAIRRSPADWKWHVRLHYKSDDALLQDVKRHVEKLGRNVYVHHADEHHLYHLFSLVDVHISQTCSTVVEAEAFGLPNLILGEVGRDWFHEEIESGSYGYARTADELLAFVCDAKKTREGGPGRIVTDTLCAETLLNELNLGRGIS